MAYPIPKLYLLQVEEMNKYNLFKSIPVHFKNKKVKTIA